MNTQAPNDFDGAITVMESGDYSSNGNDFRIPLGPGLSMQTGLLHQVCFTEVTQLSHDLTVLLSAVKRADRSIKRMHGKSWHRRIRVQIPVYELATWRQDAVAESLTDALQYLTGDFWEFAFVKRRRKFSSIGQVPLLKSPPNNRVFIPFSHGLDSFAQRELLVASDKAMEVIPVHLRASKKEGTMASMGKAVQRRPTPVSVSANVDEPKHAEQSFRTRPFLYDSLAAYAAVLSDGGDVMVPENGQGSLGGSLIRLGSEAPHRSCHPGFTTRLSHFFKCLTGVQVNFLHPALYRTKGEVMESLKLARPDAANWLPLHPSCSYDARNANRKGDQVHCGVCGNCILRRMSLHTASISDPTPYKIDDLHAGSLEAALHKEDEPPHYGAYKDIARNAARSMQRLSDLVGNGDQYRLASEVESLSSYQGRSREEVNEDLQRMLKQHRHEWMSFLDFAGESSWIAQLARG